ncbi:MAG: CBS domain-containing protein [Gemmatimonadetes bacterium]|nr:CBS domain-containing protein [Gemmatimonadota bacterium]
MRRAFRDELRAARAEVLRDAEASAAIILTLERIGRYSIGVKPGLAWYEKPLKQISQRAVVARALADGHREYHRPFGTLLRLVCEGRNRTVHVGVHARNLTHIVTELALFIEEGLSEGFVNAEDYMVRDPVCAHPWEPLAFISQKMLLNSFSFLPVFEEMSKRWRVVSDAAIVKAIRPMKPNDRASLTLQQALDREVLALEKAPTCTPDTPVHTLLGKLDHLPVLVTARRQRDRLLGILTAFDLL